MHIRNIGIVSRTYRNINRYRQILAVIFKYGCSIAGVLGVGC